eukprot:9500664-Pyramimonas_sp.AAC.1
MLVGLSGLVTWRCHVASRVVQQLFSAQLRCHVSSRVPHVFQGLPRGECAWALLVPSFRALPRGEESGAAFVSFPGATA